MRCDGEPVRPGMRTTRRMSRASQPADQNGTLSADTIRASGHVRPHPKAGHKTAPDRHTKISSQPLQCGSHPHRTFAPSASIGKMTLGHIPIKGIPFFGER